MHYGMPLDHSKIVVVTLYISLFCPKEWKVSENSWIYEARSTYYHKRDNLAPTGNLDTTIGADDLLISEFPLDSSVFVWLASSQATWCLELGNQLKKLENEGIFREYIVVYILLQVGRVWYYKLLLYCSICFVVKYDMMLRSIFSCVYIEVEKVASKE